MATNNAINIAFPLTVANGGTGTTTLTAHSVLVGNGASTPTQATVGTNGQLLIGSTGVDPAFATLSSSDSSVIFTTGAGTLNLGGRFVQQVSTSTATTSTTTSVIPNDDTIPQNTEGSQILSLAITPKSSSNILYIYAFVCTSDNTAGDVVAMALFQDSTANALNALQQVSPAATVGLQPLRISHKMTAGTTSSTTFAVRVGVSNGANTCTINGLSGAARFGGVWRSFMWIYEYSGA
jgi:hypothetical protein